MKITATGGPVGAVVTGFDPNDLSKGETADLYRAFIEYGVLVLKGLNLDPAGHIRLSSLFGAVKDPHEVPEQRHPDEPQLNLLNANGGQIVDPNDPDADKIIGQIAWHADHMYTLKPYKGSVLHAIVVPEKGGYTGWIDTSRVYRELPYSIKCKLQTLRVVHSYNHAYKNQTAVRGGMNMFPAVSQPLVIVHPETDRPALNAAPAGALGLIGAPQDEAAELFDYLTKVTTREENAYVHHWEPGDLVAWDNLRTIHRAYGHAKRYQRVMHSAGLKGEMITGQYVKDEDAPALLAA
jgi:taurine dioxygenase